jgi:UDP-GlcNAc:undecaprenyl-phosphate GlcNAc-1-phosphate transferase
MIAYVPILIEASVISLLLTPIIREGAIRTGLVYMPNSRTVHDRPMPIMGGVAIFIAFSVTVLHRVGLGYDTLGLLLGALIIVAVGMWDDIRELRPLPKLIGQILAAVVAVRLGVKIEFITNPFGSGMIYLGFWGIPLTVLWIVGMVNVVNFLDGLDGLAAGVSIIGAFSLFAVASSRGQVFASALAVALAGSALGFLPYNFNPASIFMGDAGAMLLGFTLAVISVEGALKGAATLALAVPMFTLGVPILDTVFSIVRRVHRGTPFYQADKEHIHHRLLNNGFSHRGAVILIYAITGCLGIMAILMAKFGVTLTGYVLVALLLSGILISSRRLWGTRTRNAQRGDIETQHR